MRLSFSGGNEYTDPAYVQGHAITSCHGNRHQSGGSLPEEEGSEFQDTFTGQLAMDCRVGCRTRIHNTGQIMSGYMGPQAYGTSC